MYRSLPISITFLSGPDRKREVLCHIGVENLNAPARSPVTYNNEDHVPIRRLVHIYNSLPK